MKQWVFWAEPLSLPHSWYLVQEEEIEHQRFKETLLPSNAQTFQHRQRRVLFYEQITPRLTSMLQELVSAVNGEEGILQTSEVELEDPSHRVQVVVLLSQRVFSCRQTHGTLSHVIHVPQGWELLCKSHPSRPTLLKSISQVVDLRLWPRYSEYPLMVETCSTGGRTSYSRAVDGTIFVISFSLVCQHSPFRLMKQIQLSTTIGICCPDAWGQY